jgi:hypothetical protein
MGGLGEKMGTRRKWCGIAEGLGGAAPVVFE